MARRRSPYPETKRSPSHVAPVHTPIPASYTTPTPTHSPRHEKMAYAGHQAVHTNTALGPIIPQQPSSTPSAHASHQADLRASARTQEAQHPTGSQEHAQPRRPQQNQVSSSRPIATPAGGVPAHLHSMQEVTPAATKSTPPATPEDDDGSALLARALEAKRRHYTPKAPRSFWSVGSVLDKLKVLDPELYAQQTGEAPVQQLPYEPPPLSNIQIEALDIPKGNCNLCEWRGYLTFPERQYSAIKLCACMEDNCDRCGQSGGFEVVLESGNRAWRTCGCLRLQERMEMYRNAQIPARYSDKTLAAYAPLDKSQAKARDHLFRMLFNKKTNKHFETGDPGIVMMGPTGTGKTHLLVGFIRELIMERGIPCRFLDFGTMLSNLRYAYTHGGSEMDLLQPLIEVPVLLLDDLGKGRNSKWELEIIDLLITQRYNSDRTTLITTNYTEEQETTFKERSRGRGQQDGEELIIRDTLVDRVGERIYSRLHEMNALIPIRGRDYRRDQNT